MADEVREIHPSRSKKKDVVVVGIGIVALLYLINPTFGLFEFIPDQLPIIGNIDEAFATFLLMNALLYFGVDVRWFLHRYWWK
jgi:uncharacterized membrane protein YkvA (DUF1232 family)